jgi:hypothetical protein
VCPPRRQQHPDAGVFEPSSPIAKKTHDRIAVDRHSRRQRLIEDRSQLGSEARQPAQRRERLLDDVRPER